MVKVAVLVSPNYKDYAKKYLADCLASLRAQTYKEFDLFLVDNESTLETCLLLQSSAPEATVIPLEKNEGFAGGNNAALKIILVQNYDYVFLVNMDTVSEPNCLSELIAAAEAYPQAAAVQVRLMLWPDKQLINSLGNQTHFLGFGFGKDYRKTFCAKDNAIKEICYASGAGVLYRVKALKSVGLYDEEIWMYNEDQDICLRFWLALWQTIIAPRAVVYHKYEFSRSITKYYWMDRNRIIVMLKHYRLATLILLAPIFLLVELGTMFFALSSGWFREKLKVWQYFFKLTSWRYILQARKKIQASRLLNDRALTRLFSADILHQEFDDKRLKIINPFFRLYWSVVRLIMFW